MRKFLALFCKTLCIRTLSMIDKEKYRNRDERWMQMYRMLKRIFDQQSWRVILFE